MLKYAQSVKQTHRNLPSVSVVIPAYNEEESIVKTLESLSKQDYLGHVEVIVVDNNSTDNTAQIAKKYGARVIFELRKGVTYARQTGFMSARGSIIASTDSDTVVPANWLAYITNRFEKDPKLVCLSGMYTFFNASLPLKILTYLFNYRLFAIFGWYSGANIAIKKDAFHKIGGFDLNVSISEDSDLCIRARREGRVTRLANFKVSTSARRFNQLGLLAALWDYTSIYVRNRYLFPRKNYIRFRSGSEVPKLGLLPRLAIHLVVAITLLAVILGGGFEIKPVRAQVLRREHQIRHQLQHQISRIDIDLPSFNTHSLPHVHYFR